MSVASDFNISLKAHMSEKLHTLKEQNEKGITLLDWKRPVSRNWRIHFTVADSLRELVKQQRDRMEQGFILLGDETPCYDVRRLEERINTFVPSWYCAENTWDDDDAFAEERFQSCIYFADTLPYDVFWKLAYNWDRPNVRIPLRVAGDDVPQSFVHAVFQWWHVHHLPFAQDVFVKVMCHWMVEHKRLVTLYQETELWDVKPRPLAKEQVPTTMHSPQQQPDKTYKAMSDEEILAKWDGPLWKEEQQKIQEATKRRNGGGAEYVRLAAAYGERFDEKTDEVRHTLGEGFIMPSSFPEECDQEDGVPSTSLTEEDDEDEEMDEDMPALEEGKEPSEHTDKRNLMEYDRVEKECLPPTSPEKDEDDDDHYDTDYFRRLGLWPKGSEVGKSYSLDSPDDSWSNMLKSMKTVSYEELRPRAADEAEDDEEETDEEMPDLEKDIDDEDNLDDFKRLGIQSMGGEVGKSFSLDIWQKWPVLNMCKKLSHGSYESLRSGTTDDDKTTTMDSTPLATCASYLQLVVENNNKTHMKDDASKAPSLTQLMDFVDHHNPPLDEKLTSCVKEHWKTSQTSWAKGHFYLGGQLRMPVDEPITMDQLQKAKKEHAKKLKEYGEGVNSAENASIQRSALEFTCLEQLLHLYR